MRDFYIKQKAKRVRADSGRDRAGSWPADETISGATPCFDIHSRILPEGTSFFTIDRCAFVRFILGDSESELN